mmetsp:Transcript_47175/g.118840  ORF Transcript_47175/g.118840 Transcript_47175/m.118840 type:complete len:213 (+) Transcript_47175:805-1443(+)
MLPPLLGRLGAPPVSDGVDAEGGGGRLPLGWLLPKPRSAGCGGCGVCGGCCTAVAAVVDAEGCCRWLPVDCGLMVCVELDGESCGPAMTAGPACRCTIGLQPCRRAACVCAERCGGCEAFAACCIAWPIGGCACGLEPPRQLDRGDIQPLTFLSGLASRTTWSTRCCATPSPALVGLVRDDRLISFFWAHGSTGALAKFEKPSAAVAVAGAL